ncbi:UNVERIFIED_CONTAM: hypothetical protein H355_001649 [Colinus virginianus]|nr:hypothetical protein H355_001649 [Colinus virginianus]
MTYGNGTVVLPIMRRVFIGALVGIYAYTAVEVVVKPGYAQLLQAFKQKAATPAFLYSRSPKNEEGRKRNSIERGEEKKKENEEDEQRSRGREEEKETESRTRERERERKKEKEMMTISLSRVFLSALRFLEAPLVKMSAAQVKREKPEHISVSGPIPAADSYAPPKSRTAKSCENIAEEPAANQAGGMENSSTRCSGKAKAGEWLPDMSLGDATKLVHAGEDPDPTTGAIIPPIFQSTTFVQDSVALYQSKGYSYSRTRNPSVTTLENKLAEIEGGKAACCFSSGMAATSTVRTLVTQCTRTCLPA